MTFILHGLNADLKDYMRSNPLYKQDQFLPIIATDIFMGEVTPGKTVNKVYKCVIDQAIEVTTVDPNIRSDSLNFWNTCLKQIKTTKIVSFALTLLGISSVVPISLFLGGNVAIGASIVALMMTISGIALSILCKIRESEAEKQFKAWENPIHHCQNQRLNIAKFGLKYILDNKLNGKFIHSREYSLLWWNELNRMMLSCASLNKCEIDAKVVLIKQFFDHNPLNEDAMIHTFKEAKPPRVIEGVKNVFDQLKKAYEDHIIQFKQSDKLNAEICRFAEDIQDLAYDFITLNEALKEEIKGEVVYKVPPKDNSSKCEYLFDLRSEDAHGKTQTQIDPLFSSILSYRG